MLETCPNIGKYFPGVSFEKVPKNDKVQTCAVKTEKYLHARAMFTLDKYFTKI